MIKQSYFIKGRISPFDLPYCDLDHDAWERAENCRDPRLLDHFLTEYTEGSYRQDYLRIDLATWKVKPYHRTRTNTADLSVLTGCRSAVCHSCHVGKSVFGSQEPFGMCHDILSDHLRETHFP